MRTDTLDLIDQIYDNARFGKEMLAELIRESDDSGFRKAIAEQFASYHGILEEAQELFKCEADKGFHKKRKPAGVLGGLSARMALRMNLRIDKTSSHMAEMVMQGSVLNITDLASGMRTFAGAEDTAKELCRKFIALERENFSRMIDYL
ncbi:MAG: hypothetical protein ABFC62_10045 [Clostridiaceae bacterium]|nr:hypothetical protein [Eubacteriales bacterium]